MDARTRARQEHTSKSRPGDLASTFDLRNVQPLPVEFFQPDPETVGKKLLGKMLVRRLGREMLAGRIVEVEAYLGADDAAAHAAAGLTPRNRVLFGPPGRSYVYFIYGNYYCLNVSCLPDGKAGGVLFRALEPLAGISTMARNRGLAGKLSSSNQRMLTSGPGRLCDALAITRARDNDLDLTSPGSSIWIGDDGFRPPSILTTPRVGITKAAQHPLRYIIEGNPFVSGPRTQVGC